MTILTRFLGTIISSLLVSSFFSWLNTVPVSERQPNTYYFSFIENFMFVFIYGTVIYIVVALPYSLFVDYLVSKASLRRYIRESLALVLYVFGGAVTLVLFFFTFGGSIHHYLNKETLLFGGLCAFVYFIVIRVLMFIWNRFRKKVNQVKVDQ